MKMFDHGATAGEAFSHTTQANAADTMEFANDAMPSTVACAVSSPQPTVGSPVGTGDGHIRNNETSESNTLAQKSSPAEQEMDDADLSSQVGSAAAADEELQQPSPGSVGITMTSTIGTGDGHIGHNETSESNTLAQKSSPLEQEMDEADLSSQVGSAAAADEELQQPSPGSVGIAMTSTIGTGDGQNETSESNTMIRQSWQPETDTNEAQLSSQLGSARSKRARYSDSGRKQS